MSWLNMDFDHKRMEILNGLLSIGQSLMKKKWNQELVTDSSWMTSSPSKICKAIEKINNLRYASKYKESFEKSRCMLETVQAYPSSMLENKLELVAYLYCCMGETSMEMGHFEYAMEYHEKAKKVAEESCSGFKSRAHFNLGEVFYKKGEYQRAIDVWTEELPNVSSPQGISLFNFAISMSYLKLGNYLEALEHGEMSLSALKRSGDKEIKLYASVLFAISEAKLELNHANETFFEASSMANSLLDDRQMGNVLWKIAHEIRTKGFAGYRSNKTDTKPFETKVLDDWFNQLHRWPENWTEISRNLEHIKRIVPLRGEAIPDQIVAIFKDILEAKSRGITQNILQMARELLKCSESHLHNISQSKNELMALVYSCLGSVYLEIGDDISALQYHEMSWKIASDNHLLDAQLRAFINLGRVHSKKRDYLQAIHLLLQKQHTTKLFECTSLNLEIGRCFLNLGYHMEALDYGKRSVISDNKDDDLNSSLNSFLLVAHAEVKMQLHLSAEQTLAEAVPVIQALNDKRVQLIANIIQREVSCLPDQTEDDYAWPVIESLQRLYRLPDCWEPKRCDDMCLRRKSISDKVFRALQHIQEAHSSMSYELTLQKSRDIVHTLENHPKNDPLVYQEILAEIYYYMGCAYLGLAPMERFEESMKLPKSVPEYRTLCDRLISHREKEEYKAAINLIEEKLSAGIFKSDLELTLLKAWNGRCYLRWSLVMGERALAAADKVADKESQLYVFVLAALCEVRLRAYPNTCTVFQMPAIAARIRKARNMAKVLDDKMAVHVIQSVLQQVKESYFHDLTLILGVVDDIARPFSPVDEDAQQTDPDETARKSDATDPVQETGPVEETEPKKLDTVPDEETTPKEAISVPDEETTPKEAISGYPHHDDEENTDPKKFDTDSTQTVEETNPKEIYLDEYQMSARGELEGDSHPLTF